MPTRFDAQALTAFGQRVLAAHGLGAPHAETTARHLVEADLLGYTTHGIDLLPIYVEALQAGEMAREGAPRVVSDSGANLVWDGQLLSGQSLISGAVEEGLGRLDRHGLVTVVVRRSHHTGCHATHLARVTERRAMGIITASSTVGRRIAPFGGTTPAFSPSPFAVGIPTAGEPILIDMTMASTANSVARQHHQRGERLPHPWLLTAAGEPSDDPASLYGEPAGTILPLGGMDNGHKGFGLILMLEALTVALGGGVQTGYDDGAVPSQSIFVQLVDPAAFGGATAFEGHMDRVVEASLASLPAAGTQGVRLPGQRSLERRRRQLVEGVEVRPDVLERIRSCGESVDVTLPTPLV